VTKIRVSPEKCCHLCGAPGEPLYGPLRDRLFEAPGEWSFSRCPNRTCGLVWLDPMPVEEDLGKAYAGCYTHTAPPDNGVYRMRQALKRGYAGLAYGYSDRVGLLSRVLALPLLAFPAARRQIEYAWLMGLWGERVGRLLEIGCGGGAFLAGMRDLGWEVDGVGGDEKVVASADARFGLKVRAGSLESAVFPDDSFDAVALSHMIEHVHDPIRLLSECRRVLKPGGRLVLLTPNVESVGHREFRASWISLDPPRHLHLFSLASLGTAAIRAGLRVESLRTTARWAMDLWVISDQIRRSGRGRFSEPRPLRPRLRGLLFEWREGRQLRTDPTAGEELFLIATKTGAAGGG
jgi:SAM-dependent methyltransferase